MHMRLALVGVLALFALGANGDGCSGGPVGVQDYGSVTGRVIDSVNNQPVANALVSIGSLYTVYADKDGGFNIANIPVGPQTVTARAAGYDTASVIAHVRKDQTYSVNYISMRPTQGGINQPPPLPTSTPEPTIPPPQVPTDTTSPTATTSP